MEERNVKQKLQKPKGKKRTKKQAHVPRIITSTHDQQVTDASIHKRKNSRPSLMKNQTSADYPADRYMYKH